jgi:hypothetical protein
MHRSKIVAIAATLPAVLALCQAPISAGTLTRWVAEFSFPIREQFSNHTAAPAGAGGDVIYNKTLPLDPNGIIGTLFVTISTTGDGHLGDALWFTASTNGVLCNPGGGGDGFAPTGWIPLQKHFDYENVKYTSNGGHMLASGDGSGGTGDMHDNGIYYTWCCPGVSGPSKPNTVQIKLATSTTNETVFIERSHFYVDSVPEPNFCQQADVPPPDFRGVPPALKAELLKRLKGGKQQQTGQQQKPPHPH